MRVCGRAPRAARACGRPASFGVRRDEGGGNSGPASARAHVALGCSRRGRPTNTVWGRPIFERPQRAGADAASEHLSGRESPRLVVVVVRRLVERERRFVLELAECLLKLGGHLSAPFLLVAYR